MLKPRGEFQNADDVLNTKALKISPLKEIYIFQCRKECVRTMALTHLSLDKMAAISQMTLSNAFYLMKMLALQFKFH